jgi:MATE family multidrug resistance protein
MFNVDRLMLAHYSIESMNAAALAGNLTASLGFFVNSIAQMATVFVGQYNGLGEHRKTGRAPWQMIYLGLLSFLIFCPLGLLSHYFNIFPSYCRSEGEQYLRIILAFAGTQAISSALTAFFVGRGQSFIIICVIFLVNMLNFLLNLCLIFGLGGFIPPLGCKGAAIATAVSEIVHILLLLITFLSPYNRKTFHTFDCKFRWQLFFDCVRTGLPLSLGKMLSLLAWFIILSIFNHTSKDLATIESFSINVWVIFVFFADGAGRAISSMSANLIGEKNLSAIEELYKLFFNINLVICAFFAVPLVLYQNVMLWFLDGVSGEIVHLYPEFRFVFVSLWMTILLDGVYYLTCGVLNSGGDTKFPMYLELSTLWIGVVLPTIVMYLTGTLTTIRVAYTLIPITGAINCFVVYRRYRQLKWFTCLV